MFIIKYWRNYGLFIKLLFLNLYKLYYKRGNTRDRGGERDRGGGRGEGCGRDRGKVWEGWPGVKFISIITIKPILNKFPYRKINIIKCSSK